MKMRKKLAAVLAAAMIASVMPMTAFAASTNRVTTIVKVTEDGKTDIPELKIELKDDITSGQVFYLNLANAKWDGNTGDTVDVKINGSTTTDVTATIVSEKEVAVKVLPGTTVNGGTDTLGIELKTKGIKGEATVTVNPWDTAVTAGEYIFATSSSAKATVTVDSAKSFYTGTNAVAKITIEESALGALNGQTGKITVTLDNDDYEFAAATYTPVLGKGFANAIGTPVTVTRDSRDKQRVDVEIVGALPTAQRGTIELNLTVTNTTRKPETGDLNVTVDGDLVDSKDLKVATIAEYGVELKAEKEYKFVAGKRVKAQFNLNEIVNDTMVEGRSVSFKLPKGVYLKEKSNGEASVTVKSATGKAANIVITTDRDSKDKYINGFTAEFKKADPAVAGDTSSLDASKIDKIKFEVELDIRSAFEGDVVLTAEGRAIGEDVEVVLATVEAPVTVEVEPMTVKVGLKEQQGGKIVITENDKAKLMRGKDIVLSPEKDSGILLTGDVDVEVTKGDLKKGDIDVTKTANGGIKIAVKRESKEASTIEITNVGVKLDRTIPQGTYEISVGGSAISELAGVKYYTAAATADDKTYGQDNIKKADFIIVGTPNTEDLAGGTNNAKVAFTVGVENFLIDGKEATMDAAPYIKDGRTMVPVRYVATALGVKADQVTWDQATQTATIIADKVIQVKLGSKNMVVNGAVVPMSAAAELKNERTFVPVAEIARALGVTVAWDEATQTATFN